MMITICFYHTKNEYTNLFILFTRGILFTRILYFKIMVLNFFTTYLMNHWLTKMKIQYI
jgi:hypothetical protein